MTRGGKDLDNCEKGVTAKKGDERDGAHGKGASSADCASIKRMKMKRSRFRDKREGHCCSRKNRFACWAISTRLLGSPARN